MSARYGKYAVQLLRQNRATGCCVQAIARPRLINKYCTICGSNTAISKGKQDQWAVGRFVGRRDYSVQTKQEESSTNSSNEKYEFQAETRMLLDIVAKSLYSEKEVFVRELISNACDALEKLRYFQKTNKENADFSAPMEIRIDTNKLDRTIIIEDTGVGMTRQELIDNLGTIAKSGTGNLVKELREKGEVSSLNSVIGQFGVGFYSSFIVADRIEVYTKSYRPGSQGYCWKSTGDGFYEVTDADIEKNGTKIVLHLKSGDSADFADEQTVKEIINKYSSFIGFPIILNGKKTNVVEAIWILDPKAITEKMHNDFYNFISHTKDDKPYYTFQFKTDAPLSISALLYTPETGPSLFMRSPEFASGVSLYSRRVLIQANSKDILPPWLRFLRGVIDSEDIPLNLSRELLQKTSVIRKLSSILTARIVTFYEKQRKKDIEKYQYFSEKYGLYLREGIVQTSDHAEAENIAKLLLFESSNQRKGVKVSLEEYCSRMQAGQRDIYYLCAPSRELAESSPYYEAFKEKAHEVLFCFDPADEVTMLALNQFDRKSLTSVEKHLTQDKSDIDADKGVEGGLSSEEIKDLMTWIKDSLGSKKIHEIKATRKLSSYPCLISVPDMSAARNFLRIQSFTNKLTDDQRYLVLRPTLEINPSHAIMKEIHKLRQTDKELAIEIMEQVYENAMVSAGLIDDVRPMVTRLNDLIAKLMTKSASVQKS